MRGLISKRKVKTQKKWHLRLTSGLHVHAGVTFPRETWKNKIYHARIGHLWQTQAEILPTSNLVNQWLLGGFLQKQGPFRGRLHYQKTHTTWMLTHNFCNLECICMTCRQFNTSEIPRSFNPQGLDNLRKGEAWWTLQVLGIPETFKFFTSLVSISLSPGWKYFNSEDIATQYTRTHIHIYKST